jgi:hypothetical protein
MAKLATVVAGVVSCRLLVAGGAGRGASAGATLGTSSCPGLGASARLVPLAALVAAHRGRGLPLLPSPWQASHYFQVRYNFPLTVIGPERGCGSSPSTTLRQPIASLIDIVERSSRDLIERASNLLVLLGHALEELFDGSLLVVGVVTELHHLLLQSVKTESKVINVLTWLEGQVLPLLAKCLQRGLVSVVTVDACRSDGIPSLLGSPLLRK